MKLVIKTLFLNINEIFIQFKCSIFDSKIVKTVEIFNDVSTSSFPIKQEHFNKFEQFQEELLSKTNNENYEKITI